MNNLGTRSIRRVARALAEALTIAEVGRLSVYRYFDTIDESVNGILRRTNKIWNIVPDSWYLRPHGWYPQDYPYFIDRLTGWLERYLVAGWTVIELIIYWGLSGRRPNVETAARYRQAYPGELERRLKLFEQRLKVRA